MGGSQPPDPTPDIYPGELIDRLIRAWWSQFSTDRTPKRMSRDGRYTLAIVILGLGRPAVPFTPWEMEFLGSLAARLGFHGHPLRLTEKQRDVIGRLAGKL